MLKRLIALAGWPCWPWPHRRPRSNTPGRQQPDLQRHHPDARADHHDRRPHLRPGLDRTVTLDSVALGSATANADGVIALQAHDPGRHPAGRPHLHRHRAGAQRADADAVARLPVVPAEAPTTGRAAGALPAPATTRPPAARSASAPPSAV